MLLEKKWNIIKCNVKKKTAKTSMSLGHLNISLPHEINLKKPQIIHTVLCPRCNLSTVEEIGMSFLLIYWLIPTIHCRKGQQ